MRYLPRLLVLLIAVLCCAVGAAVGEDDTGYHLFDPGTPADGGDWTLGVDYDPWFDEQRDALTNDPFSMGPFWSDPTADPLADPTADRRYNLGIDYSFFTEAQFVYRMLRSDTVAEWEASLKEWADDMRPGMFANDLVVQGADLICNLNPKLCLRTLLNNRAVQFGRVIASAVVLLQGMMIDSMRDHFLAEVIEERRAQGIPIFDAQDPGVMSSIRVDSDRRAYQALMNVYSYRFP